MLLIFFFFFFSHSINRFPEQAGGPAGGQGGSGRGGSNDPNLYGDGDNQDDDLYN